MKTNLIELNGLFTIESTKDGIIVRNEKGQDIYQETSDGHSVHILYHEVGKSLTVKYTKEIAEYLSESELLELTPKSGEFNGTAEGISYDKNGSLISGDDKLYKIIFK